MTSSTKWTVLSGSRSGALTGSDWGTSSVSVSGSDELELLWQGALSDEEELLLCATCLLFLLFCNSRFNCLFLFILFFRNFFRISMEPESGSSSCGFLDFVVLEQALVSQVVVMGDQGVIIRRRLFRCVT